MEISIKRSPCRISWWVMINGNFLNAHERKWQAENEANYLRRRYA